MSFFSSYSPCHCDSTGFITSLMRFFFSGIEGYIFICNTFHVVLFESWNHRLEKTSKIIKSNYPPTNTMPAKPYPEAPHLHVFLNTSRDGDSTTSLGSLFQCLTTLSVKKFFLISNLNLP